MAATRTQVYFTAEQRAALDARMKRDGKSLALIVREALERYLEPGAGELASALDRTFGSVPDLEVPDRAEWDRYPSPAPTRPAKGPKRSPRPRQRSKAPDRRP